MNSTQYVDEYVQFLLEERHKSRNTIDAYRRDIMQFWTYLDERKYSDFASVQPAAVSAYLMELQERGKAGSSIARALTSIRMFYGYLVKHEAAELNPTEGIEPPKMEKILPKVLSEEEIERLLNAPGYDKKGLRDKAMLELMYATGIRVSELIRLNIGDINLPMSYLYCRNTKNARPIPIGRTAIEAIREYIEKSRPELLHQASESSLFVNINGKRLTRQGFWKIIKHYGEAAGIKSELTPHTLRHSFGAHMAHHGADMESIKEMMGYMDISSAQVYSRMPASDLRKVYDKAHPRAK